MLGGDKLVTSAGVFQEILHRYTAIDRHDVGRIMSFDSPSCRDGAIESHPDELDDTVEVTPAARPRG